MLAPNASHLRTQTRQKVTVEKSLLEDDDSPLSDAEDLSSDELPSFPVKQRYFTRAMNDNLYFSGEFDSISGAKVWKQVSKPIMIKLPTHPPIVLPSLDLRLIRSALDADSEVRDMALLQWVKSNAVVPIIKSWHTDISKTKHMRELMQESFQLSAYPWNRARDQVLAHAMTKNLRGPTTTHLITTARHAHTLVQNNREWFDDNFLKYELEDEDKYRLVVAAMMTAWHDMESNGSSGFFGILLHGPIAKSRRRVAGNVLDMWYIVDESRVIKQDIPDHRTTPSTSNKPVRDGMTAHSFMTSLSQHYIHSDDLKRAEEVTAALRAEIIDLRRDKAAQLASIHEAQDTAARLQADLLHAQAAIEELRRIQP